MQTESRKPMRVRRHRVRIAAQAGEMAANNGNGTTHLPSNAPPDYMARYVPPPPVPFATGEAALPARPHATPAPYAPSPPPSPAWPARKGLTETDAQMLELMGRPRSGWRVALKSSGRLALAALLLGSSVDILFNGQSTGIALLVFVALTVGVVVLVAGAEGVGPSWRNMWVLAPLFYFSTMVAVRASEALTWMNVGATLVLLCLFVGFYAGDRIERLGILGYPAAVARTFFAAIARPGPVASDLGKSAAISPDRRKRIFEVLRGVLLAVPVLFVFTLLLSAADSVFEGYVSDVMRLDFLKEAPTAFMRLTTILISAWLLAGAMLTAIASKAAGGSNGGAPTTALAGKSRRGLSFTEGAVVMGLVNALFAVFAWVQFTVLFSGEAARTMHFEEYREYVRRGFGELLLVALLTMALILGIRRAMRPLTEGQDRSMKLLSTGMIGLALVMLVSAFMRMVVWEGIQFYISTQTRIFVRLFIVWLGALFVWMLFTTWRRRDRFAIGAFVAAIGFLVTANLANPEADVAAYNLRRNDELSTRYLYLLSDDAVPALVAGLDTTDGMVRIDLNVHLAYRLADLEREMSCRGRGWQSYHMARQEAYRLLVAARDQGKIITIDERPDYVGFNSRDGYWVKPCKESN